MSESESAVAPLAAPTTVTTNWATGLTFDRTPSPEFATRLVYREMTPTHLQTAMAEVMRAGTIPDLTRKILTAHPIVGVRLNAASVSGMQHEDLVALLTAQAKVQYASGESDDETIRDFDKVEPSVRRRRTPYFYRTEFNERRKLFRRIMEPVISPNNEMAWVEAFPEQSAP